MKWTYQEVADAVDCIRTVDCNTKEGMSAWNKACDAILEQAGWTEYEFIYALADKLKDKNGL